MGVLREIDTPLATALILKFVDVPEIRTGKDSYLKKDYVEPEGIPFTLRDDFGQLSKLDPVVGVRIKKKIPSEIMVRIRKIFQIFYELYRTEGSAMVTYDPKTEAFDVFVPKQKVSAAHVHVVVDEINKPYDNKLLVAAFFHSHPFGGGGKFLSGTDHANACNLSYVPIGSFNFPTDKLSGTKARSVYTFGEIESEFHRCALDERTLADFPEIVEITAEEEKELKELVEAAVEREFIVDKFRRKPCKHTVQDQDKYERTAGTFGVTVDDLKTIEAGSRRVLTPWAGAVDYNPFADPCQESLDDDVEPFQENYGEATILETLMAFRTEPVYTKIAKAVQQDKLQDLTPEDVYYFLDGVNTELEDLDLGSWEFLYPDTLFVPENPDEEFEEGNIGLDPPEALQSMVSLAVTTFKVLEVIYSSLCPPNDPDRLSTKTILDVIDCLKNTFGTSPVFEIGGTHGETINNMLNCCLIKQTANPPLPGEKKE